MQLPRHKIAQASIGVLCTAAILALTLREITDASGAKSTLEEKKQKYSVSAGKSKFVDSLSWPAGTTNVGDESIWCSASDRTKSDPRCAEVRKKELKQGGLGQWFTRSEVADRKGWTGRDTATDWKQYPIRLASNEDYNRINAAVRDNELNTDWTLYPYDVASYADGDGLFSNHENVNDRATAGPDVREEPVGTDRYSYFWKVDNPMGYPDKELPARRTYAFDLSTGGKSYESFWGGKDPISSNIEDRTAWFHNTEQPGALGDADRGDYDSYWAKPILEPNTLDEERDRDGFWRGDIDLGNGLAAAADSDLADGADGLLRPFRVRYGDGARAYDTAAWQRRSVLPAGGGGSSAPAGPAGTAIPADWPAPLYRYAVDGTEHDVRRAAVEPGTAGDVAQGDVADPLEATAVEYDDRDRGHVLDLPDAAWDPVRMPEEAAAAGPYVVEGPQGAVACPGGEPCLFA